MLDTTLSNLSAEHIAGFQRDGYVFIPGLFDSAQMSDVAMWTDEVVALPEVPGTHMVYYEDSLVEPGARVLSRIENFSPYHEGFRGLLRGGQVLRWIGALLGEATVLFKEKINFKMPGGDGFKAHQDVQAGWDKYAKLHITMLLSIDEATERNGYLELAPGLQHRGLIGEHWRPLTDADIPEDAYIPCPTRPGDAVFFDSFIPHRSGPNLTDKPRRVLYITYNRLSEGDHRVQYYVDKRASYPPDCERETGKQYVFRV